MIRNTYIIQRIIGDGILKSSPCVLFLCIHSINNMIPIKIKQPKGMKLPIPKSLVLGSENREGLQIPFRKAIADCISVALKMIHPIITMTKVIIICQPSLNEGNIQLGDISPVYFLFCPSNIRGRNSNP